MRRILVFTLLAIAPVIFSDSYVVTDDDLVFICKQPSSLENSIAGLTDLMESDKSEMELFFDLIYILLNNECTFLFSGSQVNLLDGEEEHSVSIAGEDYTIVAGEVPNEDRKFCVINDDGSCTIIDFVGKIWIPLELLEETAIRLR